MTNRAYDWVAEGEREERSRLRAIRRAKRALWLRRHRLAVMILTWIACLATGFCLGQIFH
jgi:beta-lactamase regulating signal transducer with metallopeptidase domain